MAIEFKELSYKKVAVYINNSNPYRVGIIRKNNNIVMYNGYTIENLELILTKMKELQGEKG